tara:strand:- start:419 stop:688 length:270 start_codon:yes stop_codon:yes gene_type:complete
MRRLKQQPRKGLLKTRKKLENTDVKGRTAPEGEFRIIGVDQTSRAVWIEDTVNTFAKAKEIVDKFHLSLDVVYYVHNDSNRIIYDSKKE